jgi:alkanesulfonate monooxygenase SsuD/methylene tetrahydromethanopterin reductase-like flavin-dependent oxidoreductase (luciferase family)
VKTATFGLTLPQRGILFGALTPGQLIELACCADQNPLFASIWVGDSLSAKPRPDSLTLLGGLATATTRVTLGVACMASFAVRDPIVMAYQWATLDMLSHGRMLLAVCTGIVRGGASEAEGRPWGVSDKQRARQMSERIDVVRSLWSGEETSFHGEFVAFDNVSVQPRPVQAPCPIWIASNPNVAHAAAMEAPFRRIAGKADGWMTVELFPGAFGVMWRRLQEVLTEHGRNPATFPNMAYHNVNINEDQRAALEESKHFLDKYYGPVFSAAKVRAWTAAGSPKQCVEQIRALQAEGARQIAFRITSWDQKRQYQRLVEEVLPEV